MALAAEYTSRYLCPADRAKVDAAIAAGRVTLCPPGAARGLSAIEEAFGVVAPVPHRARPDYEEARGRGCATITFQAQLRKTV